MAILSVTTPLYNAASFIERSYYCLARQTFDDWEWIVVDDGSTDGSSDLLQSIADRDERVRPLSYTHNRGRGFARTTAVTAASGAWIVLWDIDDLYLPRRLERIDATRHDGYDFWCSPVIRLDLDLNVIGFTGFHQPFPPLPARCGTHAAMACRTDLARAIGYGPNLRTYGQIGEDCAIIFTLALGYRGRFEPEPFMFNVCGNEVCVQKAIGSRRIKMQLYRQLHRDGLLPLSTGRFARLMLRERLRHALVCTSALCPGAYPLISRFRQGRQRSVVELTDEQSEFLEEVRERFPGKVRTQNVDCGTDQALAGTPCNNSQLT